MFADTLLATLLLALLAPPPALAAAHPALGAAAAGQVSALSVMQQRGLLLLKPPLRELRVSSPFGARINPVFKVLIFHRGIDYAAPVGTPVYAAQDGTVEVMTGRQGFGFYVRMAHGQGIETAYAHLLRFMPGLHQGSVIRGGDIVGFVGLATGPHLHYEVIVDGRPVNPAKRPAQGIYAAALR